MRIYPLWLMTHYTASTLLFQKLWENHKGHRHSSSNYCFRPELCLTSPGPGCNVPPVQQIAHISLQSAQLVVRAPPARLFKLIQLLTSKLYWRKSKQRAMHSMSQWPHLHRTKNFKGDSEKCCFQICAFIAVKHSAYQATCLWGCSDWEFSLITTELWVLFPSIFNRGSECHTKLAVNCLVSMGIVQT